MEKWHSLSQRDLASAIQHCWHTPFTGKFHSFPPWSPFSIPWWTSRLRTQSRTSTPSSLLGINVRELECITLELTLPSPITRHLLFCCYRPPDQHPDTFFSPLWNLPAKAEDESPLISLPGDFNAKHPSWDETFTPNTAGTNMIELLTEFGLTQMVMEPTRYSFDGNTRSVPDLYATNRPDLDRSTSITNPVSDHCCVTNGLE